MQSNMGSVSCLGTEASGEADPGAPRADTARHASCTKRSRRVLPMLRVSSIWLSASVALVALVALVGSPATGDDKRWFEGQDKVFIRQHEEFVRIFEPDVHLSRARRSFLKDHAPIAADELEKAAAGFSYFAERLAGDQRKEFEAAALGLIKLADDVRARRVGEVTNFDRALADAKRILADGPSPRAPATAPETK
jgi:hypothetical protein